MKLAQLLSILRPKPKGDTTPGGARNVYVRPDGTSIYLRPGGVDTYTRP